MNRLGMASLRLSLVRRIFLDAFGCACVNRICYTNANHAVNLLGDGARTALVAEVAAAPVGRIGENSVAGEAFALVVQHSAAPLRSFEVSDLHEQII